jgi:glucokinase
MPSIAMDLGGTTIKLGIVSNGIVVAKALLKAETDGTIEDNLQRSFVVIRELLQQKNIVQNEQYGIGISFPGIVDANKNKVVSDYVKYKGANQFDFNKWAGNEWKLRVILENDARAALIGEWQYGAGIGCDNIVMLTLGTGVGSAVISEGKLFRGSHFIGGSLGGHISINLNGTVCTCGYFGCVETEASTWVLPSKAANHAGFSKSSLSKVETLQFSRLFEEADKGDELAKQLVKECLTAWGVCAVNMVHAYDPEIIIIGGGIMKQAATIIPFIQNMVDQYAWLPTGTVQIKSAEQVEFASLLGMDYLITNKLGVK